MTLPTTLIGSECTSKIKLEIWRTNCTPCSECGSDILQSKYYNEHHNLMSFKTNKGSLTDVKRDSSYIKTNWCQTCELACYHADPYQRGVSCGYAQVERASAKIRENTFYTKIFFSWRKKIMNSYGNQVKCVQAIKYETRMALCGVHTSTRLNNLRFVSHW